MKLDVSMCVMVDFYVYWLVVLFSSFFRQWWLFNGQLVKKVAHTFLCSIQISHCKMSEIQLELNISSLAATTTNKTNYGTFLRTFPKISLHSVACKLLINKLLWQVCPQLPKKKKILKSFYFFFWVFYYFYLNNGNIHKCFSK